MNLKCKFCEREWDYRGKKPVGTYATCPDCMKKIKIVDDGQDGREN
jgi:hypothetical protein